MEDTEAVDVPIYHSVADDLGIYPMAMKQRSHSQFMTERRQTRWSFEAQRRAYGGPVPRKKKRGRR